MANDTIPDIRPLRARRNGRVGAASSARRVTSYDVARAVGVSQATVSRCFTPASAVASETRQRVRAVAEALGYVPNALARSLILRRSHMVGVIVTRATMRGTPDTVAALGEALSAVGERLLLLTVEDEQSVGGALRGLLEYPLDGLIACATSTDADLDPFLRRGVPVVLFNRHVERARVDSVCTDNRRGTATLATRLHRAGHRRFLCVSGPPDAPVSTERIGGFVARLAALGIGDVRTVTSDYSYAGGRAAFLADVATAPAQPDCVFCANDQLALGVMDACRFDLGWRVPGDVSVVGFDDIAEAARPAYALTTLHQPVVAMAQRAVALLQRRLATPRARVAHVLVQSPIVARGSARL